MKYRGFVFPDQRLALRKLLRDEPFLTSLFTADWVQRNLSPAPDQRTEHVHPLYFYLIAPNEAKLTMDGLRLIAQGRRRKIINALKRDRDPKNVLALVRNLQTYAVVHAVDPRAELEPVLGAGRRPDILAMAEGVPVYVEVFTVTGMEAEVEEKRVLDELHARVNLLGDNPFVVRADVEGPLRWRDVPWIWSALRRVIRVSRGTSRTRGVIRNRKGAPLLTVELTLPNRGAKGFWGSSITGGKRDDIRHLKGKILDKLEKLQFPSKDSVNVYLLYLEDGWGAPGDVAQAILGQDAFTVTEGGTVEQVRVPNGVLHHAVGREPILDWVDCFVVAKRPIDLQVGKFRVLRNADRNHLTDASAGRLFCR